jgi:DNA-binding CsgD family transcriptional regulator
MKPFDLQARHAKTFRQIVKEGMAESEAKAKVKEILGSPWIETLLVFGEHAIQVLDFKTMNFLYVSPSIEIIYGYKAEEIKDLTSLRLVHDEPELRMMSKRAEQFVPVLATISRNLTLDELHRCRYSRNNWITKKGGTRSNILLQSVAHFDEHKNLQLELTVLSDVTAISNSSIHFAKISKLNDDGTEEILWDIVLEDDDVTPREKEIFKLLTLGQTSEEIANQLSISAETVKTHRKNLLKKTKSEDSIDLLRYGYARGWI